jgi:peptide/nickel transport system substrate-binding protein
MDREVNLDELLQQRLSRRDLFRNAGVAGISLSALLDLAWPPATAAAQAPAAPAPTPKIGAQLIGKLEGPTTVTDQAKFPKTFKEAPQLAELVKAGKLPSVKERIGEDPLVIKPVHEIGRYGGTIRRGFTGPGDWSAGVRFCGNDSLVHWDMTGTKPTPLAAKSWQFSDGDKTLTIHLRRGMKWSDGKPFTADDFLFWFEDLYKNKDLVPAPSPYLTTKSGPAELEKVDTYAVRWRFKDPYWVFVVLLTGPTGFGGQAHDSHVSALGGYAPAHYLKQFHPKYVSKEELDRKVKEGKFDSWVNLLKFKADWGLNPELPVISPWQTTQGRNTSTWVLERNPYFHGVDTEGNQLPYVDKVVLTLGENLEVINLRAIAGEYDWGERHLDLQKLPVFLENQQKGSYKVHLDPGGIGSDAALLCNQSYEADPEIAKWLTNADFRRALSLGIDRDQLNETFWLGLGTPGSVVCTDESPYNPGREFRKLWSTYDPKNANAMLDKIGLSKKDGEGYRLRTDGKGRLRIEVTTYLGFMPFTQIAEMIKQQWAKIGIQADVAELERSLLGRRRANNETQISMEIMWGTENLYAHSPVNLFPYDPTSAVGPLYGKWFATGGESGKTPPGRLKELLELYRAGFSAPEKQHYELGKKIWRIAIEEQYAIGTVGLAPGIMGLRVCKNSLGNVPQRMFNGSSTLHPKQSKPETAFYKR